VEWIEGDSDTLYRTSGMTDGWVWVKGSTIVPEAACWAEFRVSVASYGALRVGDIRLNGQEPAIDTSLSFDYWCCYWCPDVGVREHRAQAVKEPAVHSGSGSALRVYRLDARATPFNRFFDTRVGDGVSPSCYVITRRTRTGVEVERMVSK
jgi:hypothetical protein